MKTYILIQGMAQTDQMELVRGVGAVPRVERAA
jgi:hypothetical protein